MLRLTSSFAALSFAALVVACSASAPTTDDTASSTDDALSAAKKRKVSCHTVDDCDRAFNDGTWKISAKTVDECVQNHDFPYICMACDTDHTCSFHPRF